MPIFSCGAVIAAAVEHDACLASAVSRPETARSSVDLPQPEPPTTATISPSSTLSEMPSSARTPLG